MDTLFQLRRKAGKLCCFLLLAVLSAGCSEFSLHRAFSASEQLLSPSSVTLSPGESVEFTVSGGLPPYEFSVDDNTHNTFETVSEDTARFTLDDKTGLQFQDRTWEVTVTDGRGQTSSAFVETAAQ